MKIFRRPSSLEWKEIKTDLRFHYAATIKAGGIGSGPSAI
jgi:hypothetical protein